MIKIVRGTYGLITEGGRVVAKTKNDPPFEMTKEEEQRLVNMQVAVFVEEEKATDAPVQTEKEIEDKAESSEDAEDAFLEDLTVKELRELAKDYDIANASRMTKEVLVEKIKEAESEEEPPELTVEDTI